MLVLAAWIALVAAIGVLQATRDEVQSSGDQVVAPAAIAIGPAPGEGIEPYRAARRAALAATAGRDQRVAVVSFTSYRTDAAADRLAGGLEVVARLVAVPSGQPVVVRQPLAAWAPVYRAELAGERDRFATLASTSSEDPAYASAYERERRRLDLALAATDPGGEIVYGVVVRARVADLQELAGRPEVRLVDLGATDRLPEGAAVRAPLPDEVSTIEDPQVRPDAPR